MDLPSDIRVRGRAAKGHTTNGGTTRRRASAAADASASPLRTPRHRSVTRSPGASRRAAVSGTKGTPTKWSSFVDAIASPPPPAGLTDTQRRRWEQRHAGLHDRMRTTPSYHWVVVLLVLGTCVLAVSQLVVRRSPMCYLPHPWPVCSYILSVVTLLRWIAALAYLRAAWIVVKRVQLSSEVASLSHLTNNQRRLLGLPTVPTAPTAPAWLAAEADAAQSAAPAPTSTSMLGTDWLAAGAGGRVGTHRLMSPLTGGDVTAYASGSAHRQSPYFSPPASSPATSTQVLRAQHLGLANDSTSYAVGDMIALEELARLRDRQHDGDMVHSSVTGVLVGKGAAGRVTFGGSGDARGGFAGVTAPVSGSRGSHLKTYHTGYRLESARGFGSDLVAFDGLEQRLGVRPEQLDVWTANLRGVLARHIQRYFVPRWHANMEELSHSLPYITEGFVTRREATVNVPLQGTLTLQEMMLRYRDDPAYNSRRRTDSKTGQPVKLWAEKLELERFLDVRGEEHRMYVLHRLMTLASDDQLWQFAWDSGGPWDGQPWSPESRLPTDAHVIDHYFCVLMDATLRDKSARSTSSAARTASDRLFSAQCRVSGARPPEWCRADGVTVLHSSSNQPLHMRVLHNGTQYDLPTGRSNLFYAVVLFLYLIKRYRSKQIATVDVSVMLQAVLDKAPAVF